ncbi:unnamed protein product [Phytophthora lilii]|uniref:Unnamed protein product n=1 Tax=Phytophthora lilii TaxID=2077276 RepID=A0A9W6TWT7_9STRA|nr:unnamed protein product [Phytophthora lilii]
MILSGNALPPPAHGVVCDIDVGDHPPDQTEGSTSTSPPPAQAQFWSMQCLVDNLLTEMEAYLWFCSLDAASGFWAVMMTQKARKVSAFVCALGRFEWLRMPFGLKNAPMIYQRMLDNALWGFVQPKGGWRQFAEVVREAEARPLRAHCEVPATGPDPMNLPQSSRLVPTKFDAARSAHNNVDPFSQLVNSPDADMFLTGEPDESSLCELTKSIFVQARVDFLSHQVSLGGIRADPKKLRAITELSFPASKKGMQAFLGALNYYSRFIQDFAVYAAVLYQLTEDDFTDRGDLTVARQSFAALQQRVAEAPILRPREACGGATLALRKAAQDVPGLVLSFDGLAKIPKHGGYGSCAWILWQLPEWTIVTAASAYLESTTVNQAEYEGMNNGVSAALDRGTENLVIVGDSRLAIQQSLGVMTCRKESLLTLLNHHRALAAKFKSVRYLHVVREYNAVADALASETLENKAAVNSSTSRHTDWGTEPHPRGHLRTLGRPLS